MPGRIRRVTGPRIVLRNVDRLKDLTPGQRKQVSRAIGKAIRLGDWPDFLLKRFPWLSKAKGYAIKADEITDRYLTATIAAVREHNKIAEAEATLARRFHRLNRDAQGSPSVVEATERLEEARQAAKGAYGTMAGSISARGDKPASSISSASVSRLMDKLRGHRRDSEEAEESPPEVSPSVRRGTVTELTRQRDSLLEEAAKLCGSSVLELKKSTNPELGKKGPPSPERLGEWIRNVETLIKLKQCPVPAVEARGESDEGDEDSGIEVSGRPLPMSALRRLRRRVKIRVR